MIGLRWHVVCLCDADLVFGLGLLQSDVVSVGGEWQDVYLG